MSAPETDIPALMGDVARELLGEPSDSCNGKWLRYGTRGSLKIDLVAGTWFSHEDKEGGGTLDLIMREQGCDKAGAIGWLEGKGLIPTRDSDANGSIYYDYRHESGKVLFRVERQGSGAGRKFLQHGPDGKGGFVSRAGCMKGVRRVPYRLPELVAADPGKIVYICEGEKDVDRLISAGLVATTNSGGAGKFLHEFAPMFEGRRVAVLEDNDQAGRDHAADVESKLEGRVAELGILRLPNLPEKGDVSDWLNAGGTISELERLAEVALANPCEINEPRRGLAFRNGISARALMTKHFEPIRWIVPGYLSEGMYVLAGAPKLGKSWLVLDWLVAVASGYSAMGSIPCEQGDVLGLMLEDNERRLQRRLRQMRRTGLPERLTLVTKWPTMDDGCIAEIEAWIAGVEKPRLIVVDVFARVKGSKNGKETDYDFDYRQAALLQSVASSHGLTVVVVHHTRKMVADDPFDEVSGTRGLTGAADGVLVLKRDAGTQKPVLYGRGRDLEEIETALQFDKDTGTWTILGDAWQVADTIERREIQQVLGRSVDPMSPSEIADRIGKSRQNVQKMLAKMYDARHVEKVSTGRYVLVSPVSSVSPVTTTGETRETTSHTREEDPFNPRDWEARQ